MRRCSLFLGFLVLSMTDHFLSSLQRTSFHCFSISMQPFAWPLEGVCQRPEDRPAIDLVAAETSARATPLEMLNSRTKREELGNRAASTMDQQHWSSSVGAGVTGAVLVATPEVTEISRECSTWATS